MLFSGVRNSCDMLARNSDLYFEVSASSLAFSSRARRGLLDFLVLAFHFDVLLGQLLRLLCQLLVRLLQFLLLRLQFGGQLLRLLQQAFGLHRGLNTVQHDTDAGCQLFKEGEMRRREDAQRRQLDHGLHPIFEQNRQHDDVPRYRLESARAY